MLDRPSLSTREIAKAPNEYLSTSISAFQLTKDGRRNLLMAWQQNRP